MILRYRIVVHDGPPPTEVLQKLSQEWRGTKANSFYFSMMDGET